MVQRYVGGRLAARPSGGIERLAVLVVTAHVTARVLRRWFHDADHVRVPSRSGPLIDDSLPVIGRSADPSFRNRYRSTARGCDEHRPGAGHAPRSLRAAVGRPSRRSRRLTELLLCRARCWWCRLTRCVRWWRRPRSLKRSTSPRDFEDGLPVRRVGRTGEAPAGNLSRTHRFGLLVALVDLPRWARRHRRRRPRWRPAATRGHEDVV